MILLFFFKFKISFSKSKLYSLSSGKCFKDRKFIICLFNGLFKIYLILSSSKSLVNAKFLSNFIPILSKISNFLTDEKDNDLTGE